MSSRLMKPSQTLARRPSKRTRLYLPPKIAKITPLLKASKTSRELLRIVRMPRALATDSRVGASLLAISRVLVLVSRVVGTLPPISKALRRAINKVLAMVSRVGVSQLAISRALQLAISKGKLSRRAVVVVRRRTR